MSSHWWASPESPQRLVQGDAARQRQGSESLERRLPAGLRHGTLLPSTGLGCGLPPSKSSRQQLRPSSDEVLPAAGGVPLGRTSSMPGASLPARDVVASQPFQPPAETGRGPRSRSGLSHSGPGHATTSARPGAAAAEPEHCTCTPLEPRASLRLRPIAQAPPIIQAPPRRPGSAPSALLCAAKGSAPGLTCAKSSASGTPGCLCGGGSHPACFHRRRSNRADIYFPVKCSDRTPLRPDVSAL